MYDHVAPPVIDKWGPGTRVPNLIISPFAKRAYVDTHVYETVSILSLIERRYGLCGTPQKTQIALKIRADYSEQKVRRARGRGYIKVMPLVPPAIPDYSDYRKYLEDRYRFLKSQDRRFSHRSINQRVGAHSSGWFADILAGRQKLKARHLAPLSAAFKMETRERNFLQVLLDLENAETPEQRVAAYEKWFHLQGVRQETIARDQLQYFDHWYYAALRELLLLGSKEEKHSVLASRMLPAIRPRQAKQAVEVLQRLGLLLPGSGGPPVLVKDATLKSPHWKALQKQLMRLASSALNRLAKEERDFSALTLALSLDGWEKAREEIAALRKRLLILSERDRGKNRVFQCLFQVFPISHAMGNPND